MIPLTNAEIIWKFLYEKLKNPYATAGIMGNLYVESGLNANNLQNTFNKKLNLTDAQYTEQVDKGTYANFAKDGAGYGLAQWTSSSRKLNLLAMAKANNTSVGDIHIQLEFLFKELSGYKEVMEVLKKAMSIKEASDIFLIRYERAANQSDKTKEKRASHGQIYFDNFNKKEEIIMADYSKYINSTGTHYIANSGSDERKKYTGGAAGDQTGHEWELKKWYSRPWTHVFRYEKDPAVGMKLAELGCAAALNNNIGYDQYQRTTYWKQLQAVGYDPAKITVKCEEDCSAGTAANVKAAGYLLGIKALQDVSSSMTSRNTVSQLKAAGFTVLTASKYTAGTSYLLPGDILLYENHHVAINVTKGKKAESIIVAKPEEKPTSLNIVGTATAKANMFVRADDKADAKTYGSVAKGAKVEVVEVLDNGWYKIIWKKSPTGYGYTSNRNNKYYDYAKLVVVSNSYNATGKPKYTDGDKAGTYITTGNVNVRNDAGIINSIMVTLPKNTEVKCTGEYITYNTKEWLYCEFVYKNIKRKGFISSAYLKKI